MSALSYHVCHVKITDQFFREEDKEVHIFYKLLNIEI